MKSIAQLILGRFSRRYDYDVSYLHEIAESNPGAFLRYLMIAPLGQYRKAAPVDAYFAAKMVATMRADCGPCLNLVANMAREANVDKATVMSVLRDESDGVSDDVQLAMRYANAVIDQDAVRVTETHQAIVERWGKAAVTDMSLAVTFGTFYPMFKRGLGHAQSCEPITHELVG